MNDKTEHLIVGKHYPALDGLRGVAVLLVIWFHSSCIILPQCFVITRDVAQLSDFNHFYYIATMFGHTGVDLFFVISGFLITGILIDTRNDQNCLKNFYIRRSLRIFPLYYAALLLFITYIALSSNISEVMGTQMLMHVFYLQNWWPTFRTGEFDMISHTWSLAVEEQFYLFWPLLFLSFYKGRIREVLPLCCFLIFFSWFLRFYLSDIEKYKLAYTSTISRLDTLILGALLSVVCHHYLDILKKQAHIFKYLAIISFLGLVAFFYFNAQTTNIAHAQMTKIGLTGFSIFYTILLAYIFLGKRNSITHKLFNIHFLRQNGKISYGLYVIHVPVLYAIKRSGLLNEMGFWTQHGAIMILGYTASFLLASLSYKYFEKPILKLKEKYAPIR